MNPSVLLIVSDPGSLEAPLAAAGFQVSLASSLDQVIAALDVATPGALVLDEAKQHEFGEPFLERIRPLAGARPPLILYASTASSSLDAWAARAEATRCTAEPDALVAALKPIVRKPGKGRKVLLVDDREVMLRLIRTELTGKGLEIFEARSASEALKLVASRKTRPDLVLLDVQMPTVDGTQLCRFLKSNELFKEIRVVLCSVLPREKLEPLAKACGADGFIPKDSFISRWVLAELEEGAEEPAS